MLQRDPSLSFSQMRVRGVWSEVSLNPAQPSVYLSVSFFDLNAHRPGSRFRSVMGAEEKVVFYLRRLAPDNPAETTLSSFIDQVVIFSPPQ